MSLKKCVFGLHGVMWSTSTFYKKEQTRAITNSYRILILKDILTDVHSGIAEMFHFGLSEPES